MDAGVKQVVVTPVFEDKEASTRLFSELKQYVGDVFVVAVDDGSVRQPVDPGAIASAGLDGVVLRLKRNVGHQRAIAVGVSYVAQEFPNATCVIMDSDGEDLPETVGELTEALSSDDVDVVVAMRKSRVETLKFKLFYLVYKLLFGLLTGRSISFGNFMALKPLAVKRLANMQEIWIHVAASVLVSKLRVLRHPIDRGPRYAGQSKMNFASLVLHGFRAFMVFAEDILTRVGIACAGVAFMSIFAIILSILLKFLGMATPGWFSNALGILFLVLLQTGALTLMSLMLTGIVRGGNILSTNYKDFIDDVLPA